MLLISEASSVVPARPTTVALRKLMAAEIHEQAEAYFLANRLERSYSNLKAFSWPMSPMIVSAGMMLGALVDSSSLITLGAGSAMGAIGAIGLNLAAFRQGRRAKKARDRYENLEVEMLLQEEELKRDLT